MKPLLSIVMATLLCQIALAERILDTSFFADRTHNLLTFNVYGDGTEFDLPKGSIVLIPAREYTQQGVSRIDTAYWGRDSSDEFTDLIGEFASAPIYCPVAAAGEDDPSIFEFSPGIRSFGAWIFRNTRLRRPTFLAYDSNDKLIESVKFEGDAIDDSRLINGDEIEFGFLGIATDREIAYVTFPVGAVIDDFYYSPEPTTAILLVAGVATLIRRRR